MGDVIRRTGVFLQGVSEILRKSDDERAKCPRCRGSGHLNVPSIWHSASNAPCLFCEGVGVMPIVGLRGYIIGRTVAMLRSTNKQEMESRPATQANTQATKISTRRHCRILSRLLYNPLAPPVWLLEAHREASQIQSSLGKAVEHFSDHRDADEPSPVGLLGLDRAGWRYRHRFYARSRAPFSKPTSTSQADSRVLQGPAADGLLQGSDLRGTSVAIFDFDSRRHVRTGLQDSNKRMKSSPRGNRSSRRPRNRIREKAEKEAETRARRVQRRASEASSDSPRADSRGPLLLRMCRSFLLFTTPDPKKRRIQEIPDSRVDAA